MNAEEKLSLIKRNSEEIITEQELIELLQRKERPVAYCGYEPSGPMHLGHFVTITKLMDLKRAGFRIKVLLADIHAFINRKGSEDEIQREVQNWKRTIEAIGLEAEVVLGSSYQFSKEYQEDVLRLAQKCTINRGLRSMQEVARDIENATISQVIYPLMQVADIKHLGIDLAEGGMEQRKIHMLGRESADIIGHRFIALHTPLITSLKGPGQKMSKSIPGSGIAVTDSYDEIKRTLRQAYCPEKVVEDNPVLQIARLIIFPRVESFRIERPEKYGGNLEIESYEELERRYASGEIYPLDLKNAVADHLERIISPIRERWNK